jgi:hypothetical protein
LGTLVFAETLKFDNFAQRPPALVPFGLLLAKKKESE